jgi:hypothetical protein
LLHAHSYDKVHNSKHKVHQVKVEVFFLHAGMPEVIHWLNHYLLRLHNRTSRRIRLRLDQNIPPYARTMTSFLTTVLLQPQLLMGRHAKFRMIVRPHRFQAHHSNYPYPYLNETVV